MDDETLHSGSRLHRGLGTLRSVMRFKPIELDPVANAGRLGKYGA